MSKEDGVFSKMFYELYKLKDNYGVDNQVKFYDSISAIIKNSGVKISEMQPQTQKWEEKTNLAIYKEGLGIIPIGDLSILETADNKRIPLEDFDGDYFDYKFIMLTANPGNPKEGKAGQNKFKLTNENGKYILKKGENGGFDIKEETIPVDNKKYITFSVKDYLTSMIPELKV